MSQRLDFVTLAQSESSNLAQLCRRFGISRKTAYKWLRRYRSGGSAELRDRSRKPAQSPKRTPASMESRVVALRTEHPSWGARKLRRRLQALGVEAVPTSSTVGRILRRHDLIAPDESLQHRPWQRFVRAEPNHLWQMDFKGHFELLRGGRCHPLTILDDCSRYAVGLFACGNETSRTVQGHLHQVFERYGLPEEILCDNGPPWSGSGYDYTGLAVWLMRLGIRVLHGRPFHPQTQGKDERFHRTLKGDLLARNDWADLPSCQKRFDQYRQTYNHDRPHEALQLEVPASRYSPSRRNYPSQLLPIVYDAATLVRRVKSKGEITFHSRFFYIGRAFCGFDVALHPAAKDGIYRVSFAAIPIGQLDLTVPNDLSRGSYYPMLPPYSEV
jgi:transposase InsO family protein